MFALLGERLVVPVGDGLASGRLPSAPMGAAPLSPGQPQPPRPAPLGTAGAAGAGPGAGDAGMHRGRGALAARGGSPLLPHGHHRPMLGVQEFQ